MILTVFLALSVLFLLLYLLILRHSIREAAGELDEKLKTDTNTLISMTGRSAPSPRRSTTSRRRSLRSACGCKSGAIS